MPLRKPIAILQKVGSDSADAPAEPAYEVVGVIRAKYHFKTRPRALITAPEAGKRPKAAHAGTSVFFKAAAT